MKIESFLGIEERNTLSGRILPIPRVIQGLNLAYNGEALCKIARKGEYRGKLFCRLKKAELTP